MGNSRVYRIHTGDELRDAYGMAQRLLAQRDTTCSCPHDVRVSVDTGSHRSLERFLGIETVWAGVSIPAHLFTDAVTALEPHLGPDDHIPHRHRDGSAWLMTDLTPAVVAALRELPPMAVDVQTTELPLDRDLAEAVLTVIGGDPARIAWNVCWTFNHSHQGFELGLNGRELYVPDPPPGHSLYVHVSDDEQAHELAAAVGARVLAGPELGW
ncbi:hypothetical protein [Actinoplanes sp. URMC 104]|uniref:hypothetical protein n=1 Tax=Actinoplanes sp. URMC 104 TaxID=3423409 RepID=UPI003F19E0DD